MSSHDRAEGEYSLTEPASGPAGQGTPARVDRDAETIGESAGGFFGGSTGMALGAIGGPVGLVLGGLAGAIGGWWAGRGIADAITADDDSAYRRAFDRLSDHAADRRYEDVRPAYIAGHLAGRNPDYDALPFEDIEDDLRRSWTAEVSRGCGDWRAVRRYARAGFDRARGQQDVAGRTDD